MSDKTTARAARSLGGIVMTPPITREIAANHFQAELPQQTWEKICRAFMWYGFALDDLKASRSSKSKDPKKASWHERQKNTVKALDAALDRLGATRKHGEFLREASENYALQTLGYSAGAEIDAQQMLNDAYQKVLHALIIIERSKPLDIEVPTEAAARTKLVRDIRDALVEAGIEAKPSTGFALDAIDRSPRLSDLKLFEQFLDLLGIGDEMTVGSFAEFIRSALAQEKGG